MLGPQTKHGTYTKCEPESPSGASGHSHLAAVAPQSRYTVRQLADIHLHTYVTPHTNALPAPDDVTCVTANLVLELEERRAELRAGIVREARLQPAGGTFSANLRFPSPIRGLG